MINGKLYKYDLTPHSSSISVRIKNGRADGEMIVMDGLGNLFIQPKSRGSVHHSSFFSGGPVAYAGMLEVNEGEITKCINHSGHYLPTALEQESFELLQKDSWTPYVKSQFNLLKNPKGKYLVLNKGLRDKEGHSKDLIVDKIQGLIYMIQKGETRGDHGYPRELQKINMRTGELIESIELPESDTDPERIIELKQYFLIHGTYASRPREHEKESWVAVIHKNSFQPEHMLRQKHSYDLFKYAGTLSGGNVAVFSAISGTKVETFYLYPRAGKLWDENEATYNIGRGQPKIIKTERKATKIVDDILFYKSTQAHLHGIDLRTKESFLEHRVHPDRFKEFLVMKVDGAFCFVDVDHHDLRMYRLRGRFLETQWISKDHRMSPDVKLSFDMKNRKIWGLKKGIIAYEISLGTLEQESISVERESSLDLNSKLLDLTERGYRF